MKEQFTSILLIALDDIFEDFIAIPFVPPVIDKTFSPVQTYQDHFFRGAL